MALVYHLFTLLRNRVTQGMEWARPERGTWEGMISRCHRKSDRAFPLYGGRGITVCDAWRSSFEQFLADMGERPLGTTIDRIDNDGNYEPSNCRWATPKQQARNTRRTRFVIYEGQQIAIGDLADRFGLKPDTLMQRIDRGWPEERWHEPPCYDPPGSRRRSRNDCSGLSQQRISGLARPGTMEPPEHTHTPMAASSDEAGIRCSLALVMAARGITVRKLAEEAGVHLAAVSRLRGNRFSMLDAKTVARICRYLQMEVGELLYLDPPLENADGD